MSDSISRLDSDLRYQESDWRPWTLDPSDPSLGLEGHDYWVPLNRLTTSAEVLDMICQIAQKVWATDAVTGGLVRALNDILAPQENLCSFGHSSAFSAKELSERIAKVAKQEPAHHISQ